MAKAIIQLKIMPEGADKDMADLEKTAREALEKVGGDVKQVDTEPVAFGLKALLITFLIEEEKGTEEAENACKELEGVGSVQVSRYDRLG